MASKNEKRSPSFTAYQVKTDRDEKSHFTKVGAAFAHKDGKGHTVTLDAMPVDGRIVLRSAKERLKDHREGKELPEHESERER